MSDGMDAKNPMKNRDCGIPGNKRMQGSRSGKAKDSAGMTGGEHYRPVKEAHDHPQGGRRVSNRFGTTSEDY